MICCNSYLTISCFITLNASKRTHVDKDGRRSWCLSPEVPCCNKKCLNEASNEVTQSFFVTFHLRKVCSPVLLALVFQRGRELEGCRKCNNTSQPCDGHHYTTSTTHYCPQHPPTIVGLCNRTHSFNTKPSTNHLRAQTLCLQQSRTMKVQK